MKKLSTLEEFTRQLKVKTTLPVRDHVPEVIQQKLIHLCSFMDTVHGEYATPAQYATFNRLFDELNRAYEWLSPLMKSRDQQAVEYILAELQLNYRFFDCFQPCARVKWFVSQHAERPSPPPKFKHWTVQKMINDEHWESEEQNYKKCLTMIRQQQKK